jgi:parallel beta-helix repeat protein
MVTVTVAVAVAVTMGLLLYACGDDDGTADPVDAALVDSGSEDDGSLVEEAYYVAPDGDDSNPGTLEQPWRTLAKAAETLVLGETVYIRQGTYNERLVPEIGGIPGEPITYAAYPGETPVIDGIGVSFPGNWGGLVYISHLAYIHLKGLRVINAGSQDKHAGIMVDNSSHITIEGCSTYNTVSSGIGVWKSDNIVVRGNEVELACNDGSQECITIGETDTFEVSLNHVFNSGPGTMGGEGIDIKDGSTNGEVFANEVHHIHRLGIYVDAWDAYTAHIRVHGNWVHHCAGNGFAVAAEAGGLLERVTVENNVAFSNGSAGITVADWGDPNESHPIYDVKIINNTFYGNGTNGWGPGVVIANVEADNVLVRNNLLSQNASAQMSVEGVGDSLTVDHNLFDGPGDPHGNAALTDVPMLQDASNDDFHLAPGSPAIDSGASEHAPADDFDGQPRPQGAGIDIGAFEASP